MRKPKQLPAGAKETLRRALQRAKSKAEFQRIQCLWLRAALGLSSEQVATAIGWRPTSVRRVQSLYLRQGEVVFEGVGRGGRRRQNLTVEQERQLLEPFVSRAEPGGLLVVSEIQTAYERAVGHGVPKSTVYRMLARHGWRKLVPRPRHPKGNQQRQQAFKKNFPRSWPAR